MWELFLEVMNRIGKRITVICPRESRMSSNVRQLLRYKANAFYTWPDSLSQTLFVLRFPAQKLSGSSLNATLLSPAAETLHKPTSPFLFHHHAAQPPSQLHCAAGCPWAQTLIPASTHLSLDPLPSQSLPVSRLLPIRQGPTHWFLWL